MKKIAAAFSQLENGKTYLAKYLERKIGWHRTSFAYNVKKIFKETFGVDDEFIEKWKRIKECPPGFEKNVRDSLIFIGSGFRSIKKTIWIDKLFDEFSNKDILIDDGRYPSFEAKRVREENGISILIWRPGFENTIDNDSETEVVPYVNQLKNHPDGELTDMPFDLWIKNDADIESFNKKIDNIVIPYMEKHFGEL